MPFAPERLRQARKNKKLRQVDLAAAVGVNERTIRDYEKGTYEPNGEHLLAISRILYIDPDWLYGLTDDATPKEALSPDERRLLRAFRSGDLSIVSQMLLAHRNAKSHTKKGNFPGGDPGASE